MHRHLPDTAEIHERFGAKAALAGLIALCLSVVSPHVAAAQTARDRQIASHFAPTFYQALGDHRRADYITNFDFDGDWRGDNNWSHADDPRFALRAYVYYAVSETSTHYFIHYAIFHPRDYKGGGLRGPLLSEAIREGVRRGGKYDPTGLSSEAVLAHENDMEGCLVVVEKGAAEARPARVTMVETLSHDRFMKYATEYGPGAGFGRVALQDGRPQLYVEPKGHGVTAYAPDGKQPRAGETLIYQFTGRGGNPEEANDSRVGYELLPLITTLWPRARRGVGETYGAAQTYQLPPAGAKGRKVSVTAGSAFLGKVGAPNMARPPWGWFDREERGAAPGEWFFDPAKTIKRHFGLGEDFGTRYLHAPFLGVKRK